MTEFKAGDKVRTTYQAREGWRGVEAVVVEKAGIYTKNYSCRLITLPTAPDAKYYAVGDLVTLGFIELIPEESKKKQKKIAKHYAAGMPEGIDALAIMKEQGWEKNFLLGSILKYITRCEHKGQYLSDLKKIRDYADKLIVLEEA